MLAETRGYAHQLKRVVAASHTTGVLLHQHQWEPAAHGGTHFWAFNLLVSPALSGYEWKSLAEVSVVPESLTPLPTPSFAFGVGAEDRQNCPVVVLYTYK